MCQPQRPQQRSVLGCLILRGLKWLVQLALLLLDFIGGIFRSTNLSVWMAVAGKE
jgi:hypothetical protein